MDHTWVTEDVGVPKLLRWLCSVLLFIMQTDKLDDRRYKFNYHPFKLVYIYLLLIQVGSYLFVIICIVLLVA